MFTYYGRIKSTQNTISFATHGEFKIDLMSAIKLVQNDIKKKEKNVIIIGFDESLKTEANE
jgi:hypothetical protein